MSVIEKISRRRFLNYSAASLLAVAGTPRLVQAMQGMSAMPKLPPRKASPNFKADVELELFAQAANVPILAGQATAVMQYTAKLVHGPKETLTTIPSSYLGPIIRLQKGQKVRIRFHNGLAEPSVTHWHGLHVPAEMDGHPLYAIGSGETLVYEFEVLNRAGMNIYHPHPHEATAKQVYHGLAGALLVNDQEEAALGLPSGEFEIPIVIQDRLFDSQNQLIYVRNMHDRMMGFYGDRILVNGQANYQVKVASRAYRLRVMNGSNARIYKLGWDDGTPITIIGTDGGLLEAPHTLPYAMLAPGERLDIWADFSGRELGSQLVMRSLAFTGALPKMGMMMHQGTLPMGSEFPIFTATVSQKTSDSPKLPGQLSTFTRYKTTDTANPEKPVPIGISEGPMSMLLNGRPYAYNEPQDFERIKLGSIQLMEIFHAHGGAHGMGGDAADSDDGAGEQHGMGGMGGRHGRMGMGGMRHGNMGGMMGMGMMMSMAHPIHLHGQQFQIISRSVGDDAGEGYASVREGFIDTGLKDTVLVMPGEKVRIIKPFQDFKGLFMYHCHNLEHEDMGMMREFLVE